MAIGARLELRQGQGLVITPQLQQAIKLLQLSNLELESYIEGELEKNPLLAREEPVGDDAPMPADTSNEAAEMRFDDAPDGAAAREMDASSADLHADAAPGDRHSGEVPAGDGGGAVDWSRAGKGPGFDGEGELDAGLAADETLHDHLRAQAAAAGFSAPEAAVAQVLIDAVDEGGYLRAEVAELADRLGCDPALISRVLAACQGFEPTGVFARSVRECLELQLRDRDRFDPAMAALLHHLELLARRDLPALRRACGVDEEDLREMIAEVRALTPRPGAAFGSDPIQGVVPDVIVREDPLGGWRVELNADTLPRLLVDKRYHARIVGSAKTDQEKTFVADCHAQASWLVKSLDQRARTILKVAGEIVRQQDGFLVFGVEHLRPLNLKHVADAIGMHESTVSRVTSNKYVATPRGVFELKFFFTTAIASADGGEAHSAEAVRHRIKALIETEERPGAEGVLSDDRIVEILKETGVDIARRTVAKYREALRIPSSVERKRLARVG